MQEDIDRLMDEVAALTIAVQDEQDGNRDDDHDDDSGPPANSSAASTVQNKNCPVCFGQPSTIFCCQECDNMVCGDCMERLDTCPICRQDFREKPPLRNKFAERLIISTNN